MAHLVMLGVFVVGVPAAVLLGRRGRRTGAIIVSRALALLLLVAAVPFLVLDLATRFEVGVSLPLHLSDLAWMAAALALWTRWRWAVALTYFWGLVLTTQAIVTPSLGEDFPDPRFVGFWVLHLLVVWAAIYLVWGLGLAPRWHEYRIALGLSSGSALDLLGPWPVYVAAEIAIVAVVWALMTWPWVHRAEAATSGSG